MHAHAHGRMQDLGPTPAIAYGKFWQTYGERGVREFWSGVPQLNDVNRSRSKLPVVYMRCSDSPFNRHPFYKLPTDKYTAGMAQKLLSLGFKEAALLMCTQVRRRPVCSKEQQETICGDIGRHIISVFEKEGVRLKGPQCGSVLQDWFDMHRAPFTASLTTSSYSFTAKIHDLENFLMPSFPRPQRDWIVAMPWLWNESVAEYHSSTVDHMKIKNYCDYQELLREMSTFAEK